MGNSVLNKFVEDTCKEHACFPITSQCIDEISKVLSEGFPFANWMVFHDNDLIRIIASVIGAKAEWHYGIKFYALQA